MQAFGTLEYEHGVTAIDIGLYRPGLAACYLLRQGDRLAFIDTGTYHTVPRLLELLQAMGLGPEQVDYVIPTHVHLDHAGGAGELMRRCPNARLVVHPKGAPHLIDPAKLIAGASAVYGEAEFARDYGTLVPVPEERVLLAPDGFELELNGRALVFLDTPGHANHHFCVFDRLSQGFFSGDTCGISYREFECGGRPFVFAPTTPVAFDPESWQHSLDRILQYEPQAFFLTHFGRIRPTPDVIDQLRASIRRCAEIALAEQAPKEGRQGRIHRVLERDLVAGLEARRCGLAPERARELLAVDSDLNAQGLEVWLRRREKRQAQAARAG
jgi:glyoxylase-like metal-dependent hydrolase (beta-lactamase superfamily II)